jgi:phospholipid transport system substrate-binding protein
MILRRSFCALALVAACGFATASARAAADPAGFIGELVRNALVSLGDRQLSPQARDTKFRVMLEQNFDVPRISRFVLGRYWKDASEQDRERFQKLFQDYVVRAYAARFTQYTAGAEDQFKVTGTRAENDTTSIVTSHILRDKGPPIRVDWRVHSDKGQFKITDVDVEGVSMALAQREEFASVIQRNGGNVAGLNQSLEQRLASGDTSLVAQPVPKSR